MSEMFRIRAATEDDVPLILRFIRELAEYERLPHECVATEESIRTTLFGERSFAEVLILDVEQTLLSASKPALPADSFEPAGFALYFHNYSTFLARPGIYLEDLYVRPELRGKGYGKALLTRLAALAVERGCGRLEWAVLNWNEPAIEFYRSLGARPMSEWTVFRLTGEELERVACYSRPSS